MSQIVPFIVAAIVVLQIIFFIWNVFRMVEYKNIFNKVNSWSIVHNQETKFVSGIYGHGNKVFESIKDSINKYLENNSGSVIDFSLLKDAVDRHCDSVENDINTLTPTPLYCGLAGTMAGVVVGLVSLLKKEAITNLLLNKDDASYEIVADGVNDLLSGVGWAMLASIMGILLTTIASLLFKRFKLEGESGKNTFLAWLQAKLLPELPSDTSDALNRLVKNLNRFNSTFAENTSSLRGALSEVNESYRIQGDIIKAVHDMDVMKMAKANVRVLEELKECTDKLEQFNEYLDDIHGYTDAIHTFTSQFEQESSRLHILEEIQQYFMRHKAEIARDSADVDVALRDALRTLKETASTNTNELNSTFVRQAEEFKRVIADERDSFEKLNNELRSQFSSELNQIPMLQKQLAEIAGIPAKLDNLIEQMERANNTLVLQVNSIMSRTAKELSTISLKGEHSYAIPQVMPAWMKWIILISVIVIAVACISNTIYSICYLPNSQILLSNKTEGVSVNDSIMENRTNEDISNEGIIKRTDEDVARSNQDQAQKETDEEEITRINESSIIPSNESNNIFDDR